MVSKNNGLIWLNSLMNPLFWDTITQRLYRPSFFHECMI